nr:MAG TPA: hypothetical protein [Caudoviricetes sp.]
MCKIEKGKYQWTKRKYLKSAIRLTVLSLRS